MNGNACRNVEYWPDCKEEADLHRCELKFDESLGKNRLHEGVSKVAESTRKGSHGEASRAKQLANGDPVSGVNFRFVILVTLPSLVGRDVRSGGIVVERTEIIFKCILVALQKVFLEAALRVVSIAGEV